MNPIGYLFTKRIRGFRLAEVAAFGCLTVLVLGVYFSKAHAGGETAKIDDVEQQITEEQHHVRLLGAELAHLEEPARIERLSQDYLGLAPIDPKHETQPDDLMEIARQAASPSKKPAPVGMVPAALPVQAAAPRMVSDGATR
jgi:cell division protein FtsL